MGNSRQEPKKGKLCGGSGPAAETVDAASSCCYVICHRESRVLRSLSRRFTKPDYKQLLSRVLKFVLTKNIKSGGFAAHFSFNNVPAFLMVTTLNKQSKNKRALAVCSADLTLSHLLGLHSIRKTCDIR